MCFTSAIHYMATSVIPKSNGYEIETLTNKLQKVQFKAYGNVSSIEVDVGFIPSNSRYGHIILFNANMNLLCGISYGGVINVYKWSDSTVNITASISGRTLTITASSTLWGITTLLIDNN